jgi:CubicO group peptidase (beta-lactamase class C family)
MGLAMLYASKPNATADGTRTFGGDPVANDDPWKIGSIGKPLCTSVVARLIERGTLDWSTPVSDVLQTPGMNPAYAAVTLEEIMHHRGGFQADTNFDRAKIDRIAAGATNNETLRANYAADVLSRPPGGKRGDYIYSNAGFAVLGHIAEVKSGKPYEQLLHQEVFQPLRMTRSYALGDTMPAHPAGYVPSPGGPQLAPAFAPALEAMVAPAGGGIWLSMPDLVRFGAAHMAGIQGRNGFLRAATVKRLHTGMREPDGPLVYACGWGITQEPGIGEMHGHNGGDGTFYADFGFFPKLNLVVASATNLGRGPDLSVETAVRAVGKRYARG